MGKQMPAILLILGAVALLAINHEYQQIKARLAITQGKVDALADETDATVEILGAAIQDLRDVFARFKAEQTRNTPEAAPEVTPEVSPQFSPQIKPRIVMHSGASCGPCNQWKSKEQPKWERTGWTVDVITETDSPRAWPWFEIYDSDGSRFEVDGPLDNIKFKNAKQKLTR
jgi:hypothetical protein